MRQVIWLVILLTGFAQTAFSQGSDTIAASMSPVALEVEDENGMKAALRGGLLGGARDYFNGERAFVLYEENDAFTGTDVAYTQGIRLHWNFAQWDDEWGKLHYWTAVAPAQLALKVFRTRNVTLWEGAAVDPCIPAATRGERGDVCGAVSYSLGQTIHTPDTLTRPRVQPRDRPYAGYLFVSRGGTTVYRRGSITQELWFGFTGKPSFAREAQSLAHWTWASGAPKPEGWGTQLSTAFHGLLRNEYSIIAIEHCRVRSGCNGTIDEKRVFDLSPRLELMLGTPITRASLGGVVRVGWRFPEVAGTQRIPVTKAAGSPSPDWWWMVFGSADTRLVGYNAFVEGTYADRGRDEWWNVREIDPKRLLVEKSVGGALGHREGSLTVQWVDRSPEFIGGNPHRFFSLALAIRSNERN